MNRWTYGLVGYLIPVFWILGWELWAVFHKPSYTITQIITQMPSSLLYALTGFAAVWTSVHWVQTYRTKRERKRREQGQD